MSDSMRIIFAGTPDFAAQHLTALLAEHHSIVGVLTQPDRPSGRGNKLTMSPVKQLALQHRLPLFQPESLRSMDNQQLIASLNADLMVVVAYGLILPYPVLAMPRLGCINVHGSLLPRWRGAAPIQRALWAGDQETGITIMQMDEDLDTGDILYKMACPIQPQDTSATLYDRLAKLGVQGLLATLTQLKKGSLKPEKQNDVMATYANKLNKEEARLDWSLSAQQLDRCVRAFNPWPVSFLVLNGQRVKVWRAEYVNTACQTTPGTILQTNRHGIQIATTEGILNLIELQLAGKKRMLAQDLLNSRNEWFKVGHILT